MLLMSKFLWILVTSVFAYSLWQDFAGEWMTNLNPVWTFSFSNQKYPDIIQPHEKIEWPSSQFYMPDPNLIATCSHGGQLGNQMSAYATLIAFCQATNFSPIIYEVHYRHLQEAFGSNIITDKSAEIQRRKFFRLVLQHYQFRDETELQEIIREVKTEQTEVLLSRFPACVTLIAPYRHVIKKQFTFQERIQEATRLFLNKVSQTFYNGGSDETTFVGIHVRRNDYKDKLEKLNTKLVGVDFFQVAVNVLKEKLQTTCLNANKLVFVVASDDPAWCKSHLPEAMPKENFAFTTDFYESYTPPPNITKFTRSFDLSVLSSCNHSIYDYGTFGFWGAFLADGFAVTARNLGETSDMNSVENQVAAIHNVEKANLDRWIWIDVEKLTQKSIE